MASSSVPTPLVNDDFSDLEHPELDTVQLDALVVMKIIKHCKESLPDLVTGQLLGLAVGKTLEVTNCFPFPTRENDGGDATEQDSGAEYQIEMMRHLREVNVDNNTVGWYQSTYLGSFLNESMIETQYNYQANLKKCVVVVFDPLKTSHGSLSLKAYRLTQSFMDLYAQKKDEFTQENIQKAGLSFNQIFEEVKIQIHNSLLVNACLYELEDSPLWENNADQFDSLDLASNPFMEKNLECLMEYIDELSKEHSKFQGYQRALHWHQAQLAAWLQNRRAENANRKANGEEELPEEEDPSVNSLFRPMTPLSMLDSLLITNQINNYCQQINQFATQSFTKLFLFEGLQK